MIIATPEQERILLALLPGARMTTGFLWTVKAWVNGPERHPASILVKFLEEQ